MKRIVCLFLILILMFSTCVMVNAHEIVSESISMVEPTTGNKIPQTSSTQNVNITFFVSNGKAYVSYFCAANVNDISVNVVFEKKTLGLFWVNIGDEYHQRTDKKYLSGSCTVDADGSGEYRVTVTFNVAGEKMKQSAVYEYNENILLGDANSDGKITSNDARLILRFSAKLDKFTEKQKEICDINKDGSVNASDARIALKMSAKLI